MELTDRLENKMGETEITHPRAIAAMMDMHQDLAEFADVANAVGQSIKFSIREPVDPNAEIIELRMKTEDFKSILTLFERAEELASDSISLTTEQVNSLNWDETPVAMTAEVESLSEPVNTTGRTPRELAERVGTLEKALSGLVDEIESKHDLHAVFTVNDSFACNHARSVISRELTRGASEGEVPVVQYTPEAAQLMVRDLLIKLRRVGYGVAANGVVVDSLLAVPTLLAQSTGTESVPGKGL